ncbi:MAG: EamA family transporter [Alphaproteobacteria bacterium]|nr:EamA family transporter [Alphaproteobacteria bacterium]MBU1514490.1 EamA family transporter [Alphaproteobacteria bacterium]MBU2096878.1 EamA family transporter [Alphaproteobacteria bacterium]MBU2153505.1 EamA family transporter [Alphaproteobacteria bacterium]MBU2305990.1 EamA family transporter [Alphaproteobacteria bacterium]
MTPKDMALCSVFAVALPLGQMLFKWGAVYNERLSGPFLARVIVNYPLIGAFAWYGVTALLWFYVLTRVPLSSAYAFSLIGSCLVPLVGWLVFKEQASWTMVAGYGLIIAGLFLVVRPV